MMMTIETQQQQIRPLSVEDQVRMMSFDQRLQHELNNSLCIISGNLEIFLRNHKPSAELTRATTRLGLAFKQVRELARDMALEKAGAITWFTLDAASCNMVELQECDPERRVYYYLLRDNPAVTVATCDAQIEDCQDCILPVAVHMEWCLGLLDGNAHLRGQRTHVITLFCGKRLSGYGMDNFSEWITKEYGRDHGR